MTLPHEIKVYMRQAAAQAQMPAMDRAACIEGIWREVLASNGRLIDWHQEYPI
jgi:hypothetical protein